MRVATYGSGTFGSEKKLCCDLCGEKDFDKLLVQGLGIAVGLGGDDFTFCQKCWEGKNLGKRLLQLLGYEHGIKYKEDRLSFVEIDTEV